MTEDELVGWHHWLNTHEFGWALGDGEGQGSLVWYSPWGHKESDMMEQLNNRSGPKWELCQVLNVSLLSSYLKIRALRKASACGPFTEIQKCSLAAFVIYFPCSTCQQRPLLIPRDQCHLRTSVLQLSIGLSVSPPCSNHVNHCDKSLWILLEELGKYLLSLFTMMFQGHSQRNVTSVPIHKLWS